MKTWFSAAILLGLYAGSAFSESAAVRAEIYDRLFFPGGVPANYLDVEIRPLPKLRHLLTVLPGTLYRAGGAGGITQLTSTALQSLCEAGFSLAVYAYSTPFTPVAPIQCISQLTGLPNTLEYIAGEANTPAFKAVFHEKIKAIVDDPSKGPALVHCWNGYHASGELAAVALRQFCGWDGPAATAYWLRHSGGYPAITRINKYVPFPSAEISNEDREILCRQRN